MHVNEDSWNARWGRVFYVSTKINCSPQPEDHGFVGTQHGMRRSSSSRTSVLLGFRFKLTLSNTALICRAIWRFIHKRKTSKCILGNYPPPLKIEQYKKYYFYDYYCDYFWWLPLAGIFCGAFVGIFSPTPLVVTFYFFPYFCGIIWENWGNKSLYNSPFSQCYTNYLNISPIQILRQLGGRIILVTLVI